VEVLPTSAYSQKCRLHRERCRHKSSHRDGARELYDRKLGTSHTRSYTLLILLNALRTYKRWRHLAIDSEIRSLSVEQGHNRRPLRVSINRSLILSGTPNDKEAA